MALSNIFSPASREESMKCASKYRKPTVQLSASTFFANPALQSIHTDAGMPCLNRYLHLRECIIGQYCLIPTLRLSETDQKNNG